MDDAREQESKGSSFSFRTRLTGALLAGSVIPLVAFGGVDVKGVE